MAAVTGAVIAGAGLAHTIYQGEKSADAAKDAARAQKDQFNKGLELQEAQGAESQGMLAPYRESGGLALNKRDQFLGLQGPEAQQAAYSEFQESPGQQFLREQGMRSGSTSRAGRGTGGGERLRELSRFNQGLALQGYDQHFNRLSDAANTGLSAAGGAVSAGQFNTAGRVGTLGDIGGADASGKLGEAQVEARTAENVFNQLPGVVDSFGNLTTNNTTAEVAPPTQDLTMHVTDPNLYGGVS